MTYGQLRLQLSKLLPGVDLENVDTWIQGRYSRILDQVSWKRQEGTTIIAAPASYAIGTITATQGSNAIASDGTTPTVWTAAMTGRMIRIGNLSEHYVFTFVSTTSGTLDRVYEGATAATLEYRIDQAIFSLPTTCRIVRQVTPLHDSTPPLHMVSPAELNRLSTSRNVYGVPRYVAQTWDKVADPPVMQVELFPIADVPDPVGALLSWEVDYIYEQAAIDPNATSVGILPFVRPAALIAGVHADAMRPRPGWPGSIAAAQDYEAQYDKLVLEMQSINAQQRGPQKIRLAENLRRQRLDTSNRSTPWQRGMPPGGWD